MSAPTYENLVFSFGILKESAIYFEKVGAGKLRLVEIQDSIRGVLVIQAWDGTIRADGRPMGEDGAALPG
ncbi:MAG: hypothetical protein WDO17_15055 [Alphaproteobacteria bacterium]